MPGEELVTGVIVTGVMAAACIATCISTGGYYKDKEHFVQQAHTE